MTHPSLIYAASAPLYFYNFARKWLTISCLASFPTTFVINAPFGRFTPKDQSSIFLVDGIKAWIAMELVSLGTFTYTFLKSPLSAASPAFPTLAEPHAVLAVAYIIHYINRALVSPLRTPSRSKSHLMVPFFAVWFNSCNGTMMGSYLSSPIARTYISFERPTFWIGLALWAIGFVGNVYHDEILLNIRRKAQTKGKAKEKSGEGEHYAIPSGALYSLLSYPNYFCEWAEWFGFALAAAPLPFTLADITQASLTHFLNPANWSAIYTTPAHLWAPNVTPPWIFFLNELVVMFPRAIRGHQWYHEKFGDAYPKERKAVIPFLI